MMFVLALLACAPPGLPDVPVATGLTVRARDTLLYTADGEIVRAGAEGMESWLEDGTPAREWRDNSVFFAMLGPSDDLWLAPGPLSGTPSLAAWDDALGTLGEPLVDGIRNVGAHSAHISPDGAWLAYVDPDGIVTARSLGGTNSIAFYEGEPVLFSHDSSQLMLQFPGGGNETVVDLDSLESQDAPLSLRRTDVLMGLKWDEIGLRILYVRDGTLTVEQRLSSRFSNSLFSTDEAILSPATIDPLGQRLVVRTYCDSEVGGCDEPTWKLWRVGVLQTSRRLLAASTLEIGPPRMRSDGEWVAFTAGEDLYTLEVK